MNRWKLSDEQRETYKPIVQNFIHRALCLSDLLESNKNLLLNMSNEEYDNMVHLDLTNENINPSQLIELLEELGWKQEYFESNGYQWDFDAEFSNENDTLNVRGTGITFELFIRITTYE